jgi:hypothetical protein
MAEVFALPKLLSLILLQLVPHADALQPKCSDILRKDAKLSLRTLLFSQRVNRNFHTTIRTEPQLQRALFLSPGP